MKTFQHYMRLYRIFVSQFIKTLMQSKADFFVGLFGFFATQLSGIALLYLIFNQIPDLQGWSFEQLLFIYGFAQIPRGLDHLFTDNIWMIAWFYIVNGKFDKYLLRPMNLFFQVICEKLQPDALGELIVGFILVGISLANGVVSITVGNVAMFLVSMIAGSLIYTAIKLIFATLAFWLKISGQFLFAVYSMADFAKYPTEIYAKPVKFIISYVIPFAFVAYIPASYFLNGESVWTTIVPECMIAIVLIFIGYRFFIYGSKKYESVGN